MLNRVLTEARGAKTLPTLVIVHGLFGSARNWGAIARNLAEGRDTVTLDQRNHGQSPWFPTNSYENMGADIAAAIRDIGAPVDLLGHSMGGKAAMQVALTEPDLVRRLVVADIAPVAYAHDQSQHIEAMRGLDLSGVTTRGEADRRLRETVPDPALRAFFLQSLDLKSEPPRWRLNLDVLEAEMPKIIGWPGTQGSFPGPALFLSGAESHYVRPEHRETIKALFPRARFAKLPGAGHWLHADKPREFEETLRVFLAAPGAAD